MELRDLVRETRGLPRGTLAKSGAAFLLEDGSLRHETGKFKLDATRAVTQESVAADAELVTSDLARRRIYPVERRERAGSAKAIVVGRDDGADVRIEVSSVSHRHAHIERLERGRWALTDERSRNGTFLDGTRLRPGDTVLLRPGQVVRFGPEVKLTFLDGEMMEGMLRQLDPVLAKVIGGKKPTVALAVPDYLLEDSKALPPGAAGLPTPAPAGEQIDTLPEPLPPVRPLATGRATPAPAGSVAPAPPAPVPASPPTRGFAPGAAEGAEGQLAVVCPPFPPVGLATGVPVVVGRIPGNDLILPHPNVSRKHARFERRGDKVLVLDLKSANGTWVRGERVERAELAVGGRVQVGPYELQLLPTVAPTPSEEAGPDNSTRVFKP